MPFFTEPDPRTLVRRTDPFTSELAAQRISSERTTHRNRVLLCHYMHQKGLDDFKMTGHISTLLPLAAGIDQTARWRKRRSDLTAMGFIEQTTMTAEHEGSPVIVWRITAKGIAYVETNLLR